MGNEEIAREQNIEKICGLLTLEEKIGMIHGDGLFCTKGVERLGIPPVKMSDGPMGVRQEFRNDTWEALGNSDDYVTYLPCNSAIASTWNRKIAYEAGKVLGEEARGRGKDVILAPGVNIKRSPLCGRNFEYMSEDPYLSGEMAVPLIQGVQATDVAACVKHFAANNQETERLWVEVKVSDRALRELYLPAFEKAVKEGGSYALMGAYNRYRGEHCCESQTLLNRILREEWGYDGMVVSDWGGVHRTREAAISGLDIEMSVENNFDEYCMANPLKELVEKGEIPVDLIDEKVKNILRMMARLHMIDLEAVSAPEVERYKNQPNRKKGAYNTPEHRQAVLEAAREAVVLLKNEEQKLPLSEKDCRKVLVIGDNANRIHSCGGGSAEIKALYEISPLMGMKTFLGGNTEVTFVQGYMADDITGAADTNWQADSLENGGGSVGRKQEADQKLLDEQAKLQKEARKMAEQSKFDTVILIGGQNHQQDLEGHDRPDMRLPYAQDALIEEILSVRPDTVVVMISGSPIEMPWIAKAKTCIWQWYAGMEGGTALAEVMFGKVNPSGHLPETFPLSHKDCPAHCIGEFPGDKTVAYREEIFVGYRYYDTKKVPVAFPFGYGLSYTDFQFSDLRVQVQKQGEDPKVLVSLAVTNTGERQGKAVVQIYVGRQESKIERSEKELREFAKVEVAPGELCRVSFQLGKEAFSYYDEAKGRFAVEPGIYTVYVGKSVAEIELKESFDL